MHGHGCEQRWVLVTPPAKKSNIVAIERETLRVSYMTENLYHNYVCCTACSGVFFSVGFFLSFFPLI